MLKNLKRWGKKLIPLSGTSAWLIPPPKHIIGPSQWHLNRMSNFNLQRFFVFQDMLNKHTHTHACIYKVETASTFFWCRWPYKGYFFWMTCVRVSLQLKICGRVMDNKQWPRRKNTSDWEKPTQSNLKLSLIMLIYWIFP